QDVRGLRRFRDGSRAGRQGPPGVRLVRDRSDPVPVRRRRLLDVPGGFPPHPAPPGACRPHRHPLCYQPGRHPLDTPGPPTTDPQGIDGEWDSGMLYPGLGLSRHKDELSLYHTAYDHLHGTGKPEVLGGVITQAIYRLDGFMSADAEYEGGEFTTPALVFEGDRLEINFDGSAGGRVCVEVRDAEGKPIPGFTEKDADSIRGNSVARTVTWGRKSDLSSLKGVPIRLRFVMADA